MNFDVIVVGAGMAGLVAAAKAGERRQRVCLISQGQGITNLTTGCVDLLGYQPEDEHRCLTKIEDNLRRLIEGRPGHPYAQAGLPAIAGSVEYFRRITEKMGYPYGGEGRENYLLPTALGSVRPTALAPLPLAGGEIRDQSDTLVVGIRQLADFQPKLAADGINAVRKRLGLQGSWSSAAVDLETESRDLSAVSLARWLEDDDSLRLLAGRIRTCLTPGVGRIGLPAVLGTAYDTEILDRFQELLGCPLFEIPAGEPTVPGMRLGSLLLAYVKGCGIEVRLGLRVLHAERSADGWSLLVKSAGRDNRLECAALVLATGGLVGRGLEYGPRGFVESVAGLPVEEAASLSPAGVAVDSRMRPLACGEGSLYVAGSTLAGYDPAVEKDGLGVALVSGYLAGQAAGGEV